MSKKKEEERVVVDFNNIDNENEIHLLIQGTRKGDGILYSRELAGNGEMLLNILFGFYQEGGQLQEVLSNLSDNIMIDRLNNGGLTTEEAIKVVTGAGEESEAENGEGIIYMGKGGDA